MISPPRTPELLLETLGAEPQLRDAVVGDLAEEYAWIADAVGEGDARRWYWRQAMHAVPLLLRSSLRRTTWGDVRRRIGIAITTHVFTFILNLPVAALFAVAFRELYGAPMGSLSRYLVALVATKVVLGIVPALSAGYIAAWLDDRTPIVSAISQALFFNLYIVTLSVPYLSATYDTPVVPMIAQALVMGGFIVLGGGLRLRQLAARGAQSRVAQEFLPD